MTGTRRRTALAWTAGLVLLAALTALAVAMAEETAGPSVLSSGADGWLAARKYLEARGVETEIRDRPLPARERADEGDASTPREPPVWVTTFPWQQAPLQARLEPLRDFVRRGGTLIVGTSGARDGEKESSLLSLLGAPLQNVGPEPPLGPVAWWRFRSRKWTLVPAEGGGRLRPATVSAGSALPQPPETARVLHHLGGEPAGLAAAATFPLGEGRVILLPSEALSNGRLAEPGNADLLEVLRALAPDTPWAFDEFAHGLQPAAPPGALDAPRIAFDLFVGHLALLYLLGLAVLVRRFGPPWREPPIQAGSAATFLRGLGSLHHRLGHHRRAGELLLERRRALAPRRRIPPEIAALAAPGDARALLRLARSLAGAGGAEDATGRSRPHPKTDAKGPP